MGMKKQSPQAIYIALVTLSGLLSLFRVCCHSFGFAVTLSGLLIQLVTLVDPAKPAGPLSVGHTSGTRQNQRAPQSLGHYPQSLGHYPQSLGH